MKGITKVIISTLVIVIAQTAFGQVANVEQLNQRLQKNNATWVAKDNWVNQLPKNQLKRMMGLRLDTNPDVDFVVPENLDSSSPKLPTKHDWRNYQGKNWVSPMLNQANCGSCVAFAAVGVLETQLNISSLLPSLNIRLSPQFLFHCGGGACDYGWMPDSASRFLMRTGTPDEACMPYTSGATGKDVACRTACSDSSSRTLKISNYSIPSRGARNISAVKNELLKGPVMTTLTVFADFPAYSEGVYRRTSNEALGGHAISIVGYNDALQAWIIRNSWGEDWGEKGFAHIAYDDDSGVSDSTWGFQVPAAGGGYVSTQNPRDYTFLGGTAAFSGSSTLPKTAGLKFNILGANLQNISCKGAPCNLNIDTTQLKDGRYEMETVAIDASGTALGHSTRSFFYVLNSVPKLALSFIGDSGVNLNQPVSGRIELSVNANTSSPVPMSSLELHIKYPDGTVKTRTSQVVMNGLKVGWRTTNGPNGNYEIWMTGKLTTNNKTYSVNTSRVQVNVRN